MWTSDRRLYLDKDGKVVEEGETGKTSLLIAAGQTMPMDRARELGLVRDADEDVKAKPPAANKAKRAPANKAGGVDANK